MYTKVNPTATINFEIANAKEMIVFNTFPKFIVRNCSSEEGMPYDVFVDGEKVTVLNYTPKFKFTCNGKEMETIVPNDFSTVAYDDKLDLKIRYKYTYVLCFKNIGAVETSYNEEQTIISYNC